MSDTTLEHSSTGGGGQTPNPADSSGQTPASTTTPPNGQTPNGQQLPPPSTTPPRTSVDTLPADVQTMIHELRNEAKTLRQQIQADQQVKQQAEEQRLREQGQWKSLAEQHEAKVKELEPVAQRYDKLTELLAEQLKEQTKEWPATVKALDPGKDAPIEARLDWMHKGRIIVEQLSSQQAQQRSARGNGPGPAPSGTPSLDQDSDELRKRYQQSGQYRVF